MIHIVVLDYNDKCRIRVAEQNTTELLTILESNISGWNLNKLKPDKVKKS